MTRTEQEQSMPRSIKLDVRHHFVYGFYSNVSINKFRRGLNLFCRKRIGILPFFFWLLGVCLPVILKTYVMQEPNNRDCHTRVEWADKPAWISIVPWDQVGSQKKQSLVNLMLGKFASSLTVLQYPTGLTIWGARVSPPTIYSGSAVAWLVLTQETAQGSDCTELFPQKILVPQVSVSS